MHKSNLFIVGAPKCGTTAWWHYLTQHPQIYMCKPKEPHYFSTDFPNFRWVRDEKTYNKLFETEHSADYYGEASIMYLYSTEAARNIHQYNPSAKILIFTRSRLDFLVSYHQQQLVNLDENLGSLEEAWEAEDARTVGEKIPNECREVQFIRYRKVAEFSPQIRRYLDFFSSDQVMVLDLDSWKSNPAEAFKAVERFLKVDHFELVEFAQINKSRAIRSPSLSRFYRSPPVGLLKFWASVRRMFGIRSGVASGFFRRLNETQKKKSTTVTPVLRKEIQEYFREDNRTLYELAQSLPFKVFDLEKS